MPPRVISDEFIVLIPNMNEVEGTVERPELFCVTVRANYAS